jgi:hypothetical protein
MLEPYSINGHSNPKFITLVSGTVPLSFVAKEGKLRLKPLATATEETRPKGEM